MPLDDSRKCVKGNLYSFVLITIDCKFGATKDLFDAFLKQYTPKGVKVCASEEPYTSSEGTHFHAVLTAMHPSGRFKVNRLFTGANKDGKNTMWSGMNFHAWRDLRKKGDHAAQVEYCEKYLKDPSKDKQIGCVWEVISGDPPHYAETLAYMQGLAREHWECVCEQHNWTYAQWRAFREPKR